MIASTSLVRDPRFSVSTDALSSLVVPLHNAARRIGCAQTTKIVKCGRKPTVRQRLNAYPDGSGRSLIAELLVGKSRAGRQRAWQLSHL